MTEKISLPKLPTPKPWQRQLEESSTAFEAFVVFRDMASPRSIKQVAELLDKGRSVMDDWARKYRWNDRCQFWDNEVDRRTSNSQVAAIKLMKRRQAKFAFEMQSAAQIALEALTKKLLDNKSDKTLMTADQIARLSETGARLERLNHDEPSSITRVQDTDFSSLSAEEKWRLRALLIKSGNSASEVIEMPFEAT